MRWHLIGHLQGNKARKTVPLVRMIHAVDSLKLLQTLDELARDLGNPPAVCLQVNTSGEETKHGWSPGEIPRDAEAIAACRRIPVVGLMTMAALGATSAEARALFARLRAVQAALRDRTGAGAAGAVDGYVGRLRGSHRGRGHSGPRRLGAVRGGCRMIALVAHAQGTVLPVRAQPGARKTAIVGVHAGVRSGSRSPPLPKKGRPMRRSWLLLAEALGCKPAQVGLLSGAACAAEAVLDPGDRARA